jgi:hypothetical protein
LNTTDGAPVTVTVDNSVPPPITVTLSGSSTSQGSRWAATATVSVADSSGALNGVSVSGYWGTSGALQSCTTGGGGVAGTCSITLTGIQKRVGSVSFTLSHVAHPGWDGQQQTITILKP